MVSSIEQYSPEEWLDYVRSDYQYRQSMNRLRQLHDNLQREGKPIQEIRQTLSEYADRHLEQVPSCVSLIWQDLYPNIKDTLTYAWEVLTDKTQTTSTAVAKLATIGMLMHEWINGELSDDAAENQQTEESRTDECRKELTNDVTEIPSDEHHEKSTGASLKTPSGEVQESSLSIPQECLDAVKKVVTESFRVADWYGEINSQGALRSTARQLDMESPTDVGLFMLIAKEVGAVRGNCTTIDFVRAMIGMKLIAYTGQGQVKTITNSANKQISALKNTHHGKWKDQKSAFMGNQIYLILTTYRNTLK